MPLLGKKSIEVKKVGPTLVAAFHNSQPPLVWKFDLERNHSFTLTLQGEEGDCELGVTSPKGEFYPIAHFASRVDAREALDAVHKILMRSKGGWFKCLLKTVVLVVVVGLIGLLVAGILFLHHGPSMASLMPGHAKPGEMRDGVPMPADQVLRPPP